MSAKSLLSYYQENRFNPVPINVENDLCWKTHQAKRINLYQNHLGIPLPLLRECSVLEFGCNSGENALVLASFGANLTLVEPNEHVLPRLRELFSLFGLENRITNLIHGGIDSYASEEHFDLVVAEGFLCTVPNRDSLICKIVGLLKPGGLGIVSFNDRFGSLLEMTRKAILFKIYQLAGIDDLFQDSALKLAKNLYGDDFSSLSASRPFEAWWKDMLLNPLFSSPYLWSYRELIPVLQKSGCLFKSSSPRWSTLDHFSWYKKVPDNRALHTRILNYWRRSIPYQLTGIAPTVHQEKEASFEVIESIARLTKHASSIAENYPDDCNEMEYPEMLNCFLGANDNPAFGQFNSELKQLYETMPSCTARTLIKTYHQTRSVRSLWGTPYHYLSFSKQTD